MKPQRDEAQQDLLSTATWIYHGTGASMDQCLNDAADLLAALSEGANDDE